ncbi:hypothetical protein ACFOD4_08100 [Pseudoroseomonas globiformis]|uniref:Uncharacterized protein n=1 Tax=Teichococcus globiformis TaxID=2307229 RepID=A0ABV7G095_9PROT
MTDTPGSRLWPLALMGWLAAIPQLPREAEQEASPPVLAEEARRGQRTAWLTAARARYAELSAEQRDRLREARRASRNGSA